MALTANREVDHFVDQQLRTFAVDAAAHIFKGSLVSVVAAGYAAPLTAGELFVGLAYENMDNTGGAAGDLKVRVLTQADVQIALSGAAQANVGDAVYATDDATLTFTATANTYVGVCIDVPSSGTIILRLDPFRTAP